MVVGMLLLYECESYTKKIVGFMFMKALAFGPHIYKPKHSKAVGPVSHALLPEHDEIVQGLASYAKGIA